MAQVFFVENNDGISKDFKIFLHIKMFIGRNDDKNIGLEFPRLSRG